MSVRENKLINIEVWCENQNVNRFNQFNEKVRLQVTTNLDSQTQRVGAEYEA